MNNINFWTLNTDSVRVDLSDIVNFLSACGFGTYYRDENSTNSDPLVIRIEYNIVSQYNIVAIKNFCLDYLEKTDVPESDKKRIRRAFINKTKILKTPDFYILPRLQPVFVKDGPDDAFFYFKNCYVNVSRQKGIQTLSYSTLPGIIWHSQIIQREFHISPVDVFPQPVTLCEFGEFCKDISSDNDLTLANERFVQLCAMIGYLLHDYKDPSFSKAVVFFDYSKDPKKQGGTGKTLLAKSLMELRQIKIIDGKLFSPTKNFSFSGIDETTRLLVFDDIKENFEFNNLLSIITSGLTVENKFQNSFHIPAEISPKIVITSNYYIKGTSNSIRRRILEFDFSDYYIKNEAPDKKFKHLLFSGWEVEEWNRFYNFMMGCIMTYFLTDALNNTTAINNQRRLMHGTSEEFQRFVRQDLQNAYDPKSGKYNKNKAYHLFIQRYGPKAANVSSNTFTKWLQLYGATNGLEYIEQHSNSVYYFRLEPS